MPRSDEPTVEEMLALKPQLSMREVVELEGIRIRTKVFFGERLSWREKRKYDQLDRVAKRLDRTNG